MKDLVMKDSATGGSGTEDLEMKGLVAVGVLAMKDQAVAEDLKGVEKEDSNDSFEQCSGQRKFYYYQLTIDTIIGQSRPMVYN